MTTDTATDLTLQMLNDLPPDDRHDHTEEADEWLRWSRPSVGMYDRCGLIGAWLAGGQLA